MCFMSALTPVDSIAEPVVEAGIQGSLGDIPPLGSKSSRRFEEEDSGQGKWRKDANIRAMPVCCEPIARGKTYSAVS